MLSVVLQLNRVVPAISLHNVSHLTLIYCSHMRTQFHIDRIEDNVIFPLFVAPLGFLMLT